MEISHILIKVDATSDISTSEKEDLETAAEAKAKDIIEKLNNGEKFEDLAKEYSDDTATKESGGSLGKVNYIDNYDENFMEGAVNLEVGEYSKEPVKSQYGYHIIYKTAQDEKKELSEIRDDIITIIAEEKIENDTNFSTIALLKLRENKIYTPVLILTAKDSISDKLKGFRYGADDYLVKPFEVEELIARLNAIIRRTKGNYQDELLEFKDLKINTQKRNITIKDEEITLQGKQFDILEYLVTSKNKILTKEQIFDKVWSFNSFTTTNVVEVYTSELRKSLKKYGYDKYIKTIRGVGYMLSEK